METEHLIRHKHNKEYKKGVNKDGLSGIYIRGTTQAHSDVQESKTSAEFAISEECFSKYTISKRKAKGNMNALFSGVWDQVTKDMEETKVLDAFHW